MLTTTKKTLKKYKKSQSKCLKYARKLKNQEKEFTFDGALFPNNLCIKGECLCGYQSECKSAQEIFFNNYDLYDDSSDIILDSHKLHLYKPDKYAFGEFAKFNIQVTSGIKFKQFCLNYTIIEPLQIEKKDVMSILPKELIKYIFSLGDLKLLLSLKMTCKGFYMEKFSSETINFEKLLSKTNKRLITNCLPNILEYNIDVAKSIFSTDNFKCYFSAYRTKWNKIMNVESSFNFRINSENQNNFTRALIEEDTDLLRGYLQFSKPFTIELSVLLLFLENEYSINRNDIFKVIEYELSTRSNKNVVIRNFLYINVDIFFLVNILAHLGWNRFQLFLDMFDMYCLKTLKDTIINMALIDNEEIIHRYKFNFRTFEYDEDDLFDVFDVEPWLEKNTYRSKDIAYRSNFHEYWNKEYKLCNVENKKNKYCYVSFVFQNGDNNDVYYFHKNIHEYIMIFYLDEDKMQLNKDAMRNIIHHGFITSFSLDCNFSDYELLFSHDKIIGLDKSVLYLKFNMNLNSDDLNMFVENLEFIKINNNENLLDNISTMNIDVITYCNCKKFSLLENEHALVCF